MTLSAQLVVPQSRGTTPWCKCHSHVLGGMCCQMQHPPDRHLCAAHALEQHIPWFGQHIMMLKCLRQCRSIHFLQKRDAHNKTYLNLVCPAHKLFIGWYRSCSCS